MNSLRLLEFMRLHRLAVETSVSSSGAPQSAIVGFAVTDRFEIVFDTLQNTRKIQNLGGNSRAALVIGGWDAGDERTVQYEGPADEPAGAELERLKHAYFAFYPESVSHARWPGLIYVRIKPEWIQYSDYNRNPPEIVEFTREDLAA